MHLQKTTAILAGILVIAFTTKSQNSTTVILPKCFGISKPLSDFFVKTPAQNKNEKIDYKIAEDAFNKRANINKDDSELVNATSGIQNYSGNRSSHAPIKNWPGQVPTVCPPDPTGAASLSHYVQAINGNSGGEFIILDKNTGNLIGSASIGSLWTTPVSNLGDPLVLYDKYADRWLLAEIGANLDIYIAISTTSDPSGTYYTYTFVPPTFPDYIKISLWSDGYYLSILDFLNFPSQTSTAFVFERSAMLAGSPTARMLYSTFSIPDLSSMNYLSPLTADADGSLPPAGMPCPLVSYSDDGWTGNSIDAVEIRTLTTVWSGTPSVTVSSPIILPTQAFDASQAKYGITQYSGANDMDALSGGITMYRAQWKKWTGYNTLLINWTVRVSPTQFSIKWAELRQDQTTLVWTLHQEGVYAPDALNRWIGSIAMDDNGNIGLCYAAGGISNSTSPELRYTGRLKNDPLGQMTFTEQTAITGSGVMTMCGERFGDYSHTSIDPSDGITFWHTGEYIENGLPQTRIYSFQLDNSIGIDENNKPVEFYTFQQSGTLYCSATNLATDEKISITLFNVLGETIYEKSIVPKSNHFETDFPVNTLANGTYLVRIGNSSFQKVTKFILH